MFQEFEDFAGQMVVAEAERTRTHMIWTEKMESKWGY